MSKIVIGTANFGSNYGYKKNKIKPSEIKKIINYIKRTKYKFIDTANFYGSAQKILGKNIKFKVNYISKINTDSRYDTKTTIIIKRLLQTFLPFNIRSKICRLLLEDFVEETEKSLAKSFYLSKTMMLRH